jgi:dienelactone hydrolase
VRAAVAIAPAGGRGGHLDDPLPDAIELAWSRPVPTLFIAASEDSILPPAMVHELYARAHSPKRLYMLAGADHMHVLDDPRRAHDLFRLMPAIFGPLARPPRPFAELLAPGPAHAAIRGLTLAHFAAHLGGDESARAWLSGDVPAALAAQGVSLT